VLFCFFFFSSRRRHTRFSRDWSSDVCSSDLAPRPRKRQAGALRGQLAEPFGVLDAVQPGEVGGPPPAILEGADQVARDAKPRVRSEERRVGKECRCRVTAGK